MNLSRWSVDGATWASVSLLAMVLLVHPYAAKAQTDHTYSYARVERYEYTKSVYTDGNPRTHEFYFSVTDPLPSASPIVLFQGGYACVLSGYGNAQLFTRAIEYQPMFVTQASAVSEWWKEIVITGGPDGTTDTMGVFLTIHGNLEDVSNGAYFGAYLEHREYGKFIEYDVYDLEMEGLLQNGGSGAFTKVIYGKTDFKYGRPFFFIGQCAVEAKAYMNPLSNEYHPLVLSDLIGTAKISGILLPPGASLSTVAGDPFPSPETPVDLMPLRISTVGNGSVETWPDDSLFSLGTVVSLTARADSGWTFDGWLGEVVDSEDTTTTITMNILQGVTANFGEDGDGDGVSDLRERGPDGKDLSYDGNADNAPDEQQANVVSRPTGNYMHYLTLSASPALAFRSFRTYPRPDTASSALWFPPPAGRTFEYGSQSFVVDDVAPGDTVSVQMKIHTAGQLSGYWMYGPTSENLNPHWYNFSPEAETGADIDSVNKTIQLHLLDGGRGDADLTANGRIVVWGAPVATETVTQVVAAHVITGFRLEQNFPNPFNATTIVRFSLPSRSYVVLEVHDVYGRKMMTIAQGECEPGLHQRAIDATSLSSGVYFYTISAGEFRQTGRMILIK